MKSNSFIRLTKKVFVSLYETQTLIEARFIYNDGINKIGSACALFDIMIV